MTSFEDLRQALKSERDGFALVSINVPSDLTGGKWVINKRFGETAWVKGKPCDTLEDAMLQAFPRSPAAICKDIT